MDYNNIPENERLDIDDVISENVELTENVLYATPINQQDTLQIIENLKEQFTQGSTADLALNLINNIDPMLKNTNSNRFYYGVDAVTNRENMKAIAQNISSASADIEQLANENIASIIEEYNDHLNNIKKNARRELLEQKAAEFNALKNEWDGYPTTKSYKTIQGAPVGGGPASPNNDSQFNYLNGTNTIAYSAEVSSTTYETVATKTVTNTTYTIHKYKQITCTKGFECIQSWWDPSFEDIEQQFAEVHCELPYNKDLLTKQHLEEKNNSWGWNN